MADCARFAGVSNFTRQTVFNGPNVECFDAHVPLSFDLDRGTDIDLEDFARFQRDFGTELKCDTLHEATPEPLWPGRDQAERTAHAVSRLVMQRPRQH